MGDYAKCLFVDPNLVGFRNLIGLFSLPLEPLF